MQRHWRPKPSKRGQAMITDNLLINPDEFQRWQDHPGTKAFNQLLLKRWTELGLGWATGRQLGPEVQAQAVLLKKLIDLTPADIADEYGVEIKTNDDQQ